MGKLSDKQKNIIILAAGVVVCIMFAVLCYFDYQDIDQVKKDQKATKAKIKDHNRKKEDIEKKLLPQLKELKTEYLAFQKKLPPEKDFRGIYGTLDRIRNEVKSEFNINIADNETIGNWKIKVDKSKDQKVGENKAKTAKRPKPKAKKRRRTRGVATGPFEEISMKVNIDCTFHQIGTILNKIENDERFYVIKELKIPSLKADTKQGESKEDKPKKGNMAFTVITFAFKDQGGSQKNMLKKVDKWLKSRKYKAVPPKKKGKNAGKDEKEKTELFTWDRQVRNPFDKDLVLTKIEIKPTTSEPSVAADDDDEGVIENPDVNITLENIGKDFELLNNQRKDLLLELANQDEWSRLREELKNEYNGMIYRKRLMRLRSQLKSGRITQNLDKQVIGKFQEDIKKLYDEHKKWREYIEVVDYLGEARDFIADREKDLKDLDGQYKKARDERAAEELKSAEKDLQSVISKIITSKAKCDRLKFSKIAEGREIQAKLSELDKFSRELHRRVKNQIKILELAAKVEIQGIIFYVDEEKGNTLSVVYINDTARYIGDQLEEQQEFFVDDIKEDEVVLRYGKEDKVSIPIKRKKRLAVLESSLQQQQEEE